MVLGIGTRYADHILVPTRHDAPRQMPPAMRRYSNRDRQTVLKAVDDKASST